MDVSYLHSFQLKAYGNFLLNNIVQFQVNKQLKTAENLRDALQIDLPMPIRFCFNVANQTL